MYGLNQMVGILQNEEMWENTYSGGLEESLLEYYPDLDPSTVFDTFIEIGCSPEIDWELRESVLEKILHFGFWHNLYSKIDDSIPLFSCGDEDVNTLVDIPWLTYFSELGEEWEFSTSHKAAHFHFDVLMNWVGRYVFIEWVQDRPSYGLITNIVTEADPLDGWKVFVDLIDVNWGFVDESLFVDDDNEKIMIDGEWAGLEHSDNNYLYTTRYGYGDFDGEAMFRWDNFARDKEAGSGMDCSICLNPIIEGTIYTDYGRGNQKIHRGGPHSCSMYSVDATMETVLSYIGDQWNLASIAIEFLCNTSHDWKYQTFAAIACMNITPSYVNFREVPEYISLREIWALPDINLRKEMLTKCLSESVRNDIAHEVKQMLETMGLGMN